MRIVDFLFALRPLVLVPAWSFFLLGVAVDSGGADAAFPGLRMLALSLVLAGAHLVNQVVDFETDRINRKGLFLQRGIFSRRTYVVAAAIAIAGGLGLALARGDARAGIAVAAGLGLAYSLPPLRLASRPGLDLLANGLGYGVVAFLLGADGQTFSASPVWPALLAGSALEVAAVFVHTTLLDLEGDRLTSKRTLGLALGAARSRGVAAVAACGGAMAAVAAGHPALLAASAIVALLSIAALLRPSVRSSRFVCVGGTGAFAVAASVQAPSFAVALLVLTLLTRVYYRRRFALAYPSLGTAGGVAPAPHET